MIQLRNTLKSYLSEVLPSLEEPLLYKVWEIYKKSPRVIQSAKIEKYSLLREEYYKLEKNYEAEIEEKKILNDKILKARAEGMKRGNDDLSLVKQLLDALEQSKNNQSVSKEIIKPIKEPKQIQRKEVKEKINIKNLKYKKLDYTKLKEFLLISPNTFKISAILQALKLRIRNAKTLEDKNGVIAEYIQADLLDCNENAQMLERLLIHPNNKYVLY